MPAPKKPHQQAIKAAGVVYLKRGRGRPRGSRKIDKGQGDLFPAEKFLMQQPPQVRAALEIFKNALCVRLTPAGEQFFDLVAVDLEVEQ